MRSLFLFAFILFVSSGAPGEPLFEMRDIFPPDDSYHTHASSIVETPDGELIAVWYENGQHIDDPRYYYERKDKSSDVRIGGARRPAGAKEWNKPFIMADTFGISDNNPTMILDDQQRLWLIYPTLLGVPDWTWGSALVRYRIAQDLSGEGPPQWAKSDILLPHPVGLEPVIEKAEADMRARAAAAENDENRERLLGYVERMKERLKEPLVPRLGWMPRAHPLMRRDGTLIVPLSNENFNIAMMAFTKDGGETWTYSNPVPETGLTQPTIVEFEDGMISAFFRNSSGRIKRSDSTDGGMTWGEVTQTDLLHPGAGIEALVLENGNLLMIYNNVEERPRDRLAVSISEDRGKTWKWTRHIVREENGRFDYPSIIQAADGTLHATYSHYLKTIKHVHFNEEWVKAGD